MVIVIIYDLTLAFGEKDVQVQEERGRLDLGEGLLASLQIAESELTAVHQGGE
jgi:hypothetical protein